MAQTKEKVAQNGSADVVAPQGIEDEMLRLKAYVYDLLARQQGIQAEINAANTRLAELARTVPAPGENDG